MAVDKSALIKTFRREVEKSLFLTENDKKFWLENAERLHVFLLERILALVKERNGKIREFILAALKNDPSYLFRLKKLIARIRKEAVAIEEKNIRPAAEKILERELGKIPNGGSGKAG